MDRIKLSSFENFGNSPDGIVIITYDELLQKTKDPIFPLKTEHTHDTSITIGQTQRLITQSSTWHADDKPMTRFERNGFSLRRRRHGRAGGTGVHRRLSADDRGLHVSTGGFTKEARYETDRADTPFRLLNLGTFVHHYVEIYDETDNATRGILPLPCI